MSGVKSSCVGMLLLHPFMFPATMQTPLKVEMPAVENGTVLFS